MWLIVMGPLGFAVAVLAATVDWPAVAVAARTADVSFAQLDAASPGLIEKTGFAIGTLVWSILAALILYPVFQAMVLRWWASGLRFGEVAVTSRLRTGPVYGAYARFIGLSLLFSILLASLMGMVFGLVNVTLVARYPELGEIAAAIVGIVSYVIFMLGSSTIYQVIVRLALWRLVVESLDIAGISALDRVTAEGQPSSAFGEGLADALNVGGL
jgi:hypothetical protein